MNSVLAVMTVCVVACLQCSTGNPFLTCASSSPLVIELDLNTYSGNACGVFIGGFTWGSGVPCSRQALVLIQFSRGIKRAVANFTFATTGSQGYTFDLGDSPTNNGNGGDANTSDNNAEVHSVGSTLYFYGRDKAPGVSAGLLHSEPNFVGVTPHLSLEFKDQQVRARNGNGFVHVQDNSLFQLNGQPDSKGVNYDLYLGLNRVIDGTYNSGTGLCKVVIQTYYS